MERNRWGLTREDTQRILAKAEEQMRRVREETDALVADEETKERADHSYRSPVINRRIEAAVALQRARLMADDFDGKLEEDDWDG